MSNLADEQARADWHRERPDADPVDYDPNDAMSPASEDEWARIEAWARSVGIPDEPPF